MYIVERSVCEILSWNAWNIMYDVCRLSLGAYKKERIYPSKRI